MPARRAAAVLTAAALTAAPAVLLGAAPAHAAGDDGKAGAVVLRTGLDVSLLDDEANVPLSVVLNEVQAPADAEKKALSASLDGVDNGKPFNVLKADVATARATADARKAEGYANLVRAQVHVPGMPLLSVIEVEQVTSKAVCKAGEKPTANSEIPGSVTVMGKKVTLSASGTTHVEVPGTGEVKLDLAKTSTTSRTAAATALELNVSVDPEKLNVAAVQGRITLAEATCETPGGAPDSEKPGGEQPEQPEATGGTSGGDTGGDDGAGTQTGSGNDSENLAETGGSTMTPYLAVGAAALLAAGAASIVVARRKASPSSD